MSVDEAMLLSHQGGSTDRQSQSREASRG